MSRLISTTLILISFCSVAAAQEPGFEQLVLEPTDDTWATHDDGLVHGAEPLLKVGIEPQGCQSNPEYKPCAKDDKVCCKVDAPGYNYCAPEGECATTPPSWTAFRKFRMYLRFDLGTIPAGAKLLKATLTLRQDSIVEKQGGPMKVETHGLKKIGLPNPICDWSEDTLNDTNGTTWNNLVQNTSVAPDGTWSFDVTKAVADWTTGDSDKPDSPVLPNCGFMLHDSAFGKADSAIERWALFSSKEGVASPKLVLDFAYDIDQDGVFADEDCNEDDPAINPGVPESCNEVDDNCNDLVDEETCDGVDNDCDGATDEAAVCGAGTVCIDGECKTACQDECSSAFDKACVLGDDDLWQELGCGQADEDPCLDILEGPKCPAGWFCNYGSCSTNCLDEDPCEVADEKVCVQTSPGVWAVATCAEYDDDSCLDVGGFEACGKGATCAEGACTDDACTDACEAGAQQCSEGVAQTCWIWAGACTSWGGDVTCAEGSACADGVCAGEAQCECSGPEPVCVDECDTAGLSECAPVDDEATITCGDTDDDDCLEWGPITSCEAGEICQDGACTVVAPPDEGGVVEEEPSEDIAIPTPDEGHTPPDEGKDWGHIDAGEWPKDDLKDQGHIDAGPAEPKEKGTDGGCGCRAAPSKHSAPWGPILFILVAIYGRFCLTSRGGRRQHHAHIPGPDSADSR